MINKKSNSSGKQYRKSRKRIQRGEMSDIPQRKRYFKLQNALESNSSQM
jgi:hypothetical protein